MTLPPSASDFKLLSPKISSGQDILLCFFGDVILNVTFPHQRVLELL